MSLAPYGARREDTLEETPRPTVMEPCKGTGRGLLQIRKTPLTPSLYRTTVIIIFFFCGRLTLILNRRHIVPYLHIYPLAWTNPAPYSYFRVNSVSLDWFKIETSCIITPEISQMSDVQTPGYTPRHDIVQTGLYVGAHSRKFLASELRLSGTVLGKYIREAQVQGDVRMTGIQGH
jgi:hypothetical protein